MMFRAYFRIATVGSLRCVAAVFLFLVSVVDKWQLTEVITLSGGPIYFVAAISILFWPQLSKVGQGLLNPKGSTS